MAVEGELRQAKTGTDGYQLKFRVLDGEHAGRHLWKTCYFTPDAMRYSKRDLAKFGLDTSAKLKAPFEGGRHEVRLTVRETDDGTQRNEVKAIDFLRLREPEPNPFPLTLPTKGGV